jgi:isochorismate synthase
MRSTTSVSLQTKTETEILSFLISHATENDLPFAFWRLPGAAVSYVVISQNYKRLPKNSAIEDLSSGFMFAPFNREKECLYLPADYIFAFESESLRPGNNPSEISSQAWLEEQMKATPELGNSTPRFASASSAVPESDFIALVRKGIEATEQNVVEKVVPSRFKNVELPSDFHLVHTIFKLKKQYPQALVSFVSIPRVGHWLGATPEVLVQVENKSIFKTVALAGTLPFQDGMNLKAVAWTQKEIEEQALVERYVISCFKKIRVREYEEHGPKTVVAGNLLHLKSDFTVDMKAINFPQLGSVMLQLLHPTSAVCGMPLEPALDFLNKNEGYDREFYAGYLGPVNIENDISLFVNLRCMKLLDNRAVLFAGAGVTVDSDAAKEFEETEIKFRTLLNVIG